MPFFLSELDREFESERRGGYGSTNTKNSEGCGSQDVGNSILNFLEGLKVVQESQNSTSRDP